MLLRADRSSWSLYRRSRVKAIFRQEHTDWFSRASPSVTFYVFGCSAYGYSEYVVLMRRCRVFTSCLGWSRLESLSQEFLTPPCAANNFDPTFLWPRKGTFDEAQCAAVV